MSDPSIDAAREAIIALSQAEAETVEAPEVVENEVVEAVPAVEAKPADEPEQPAEAAVESPEPAEPSEPESRGYRRLLAREAKLREEQKAFELKAKEHAADLAALREYKAAQAKLKLDPIGYLQSHGLSQAEILAALDEARIADLGDLAPPEARATLAAKRAERIAAEAEERLKQTSQQQAAEQYAARYQAGINDFVKSDLSTYPQLAAVAAAGKPVAQAIWQTALELAAANPSAPEPTYAQVAAHLNQQLAELVSAVSPPTPTAPAAASATPTAPAGKPVLRNSATSTQPGPAPERKNIPYDEYREELRQKVLAKHGIAPR